MPTAMTTRSWSLGRSPLVCSTLGGLSTLGRPDAVRGDCLRLPTPRSSRSLLLQCAPMTCSQEPPTLMERTWKWSSTSPLAGAPAARPSDFPHQPALALVAGCRNAACNGGNAWLRAYVYLQKVRRLPSNCTSASREATSARPLFRRFFSVLISPFSKGGWA